MVGLSEFVNPGDNAWQLTAATLVGLMSVPGLVVLYGGVMQKRWSVNSMMMAFIAFALVLSCGCCSASRWRSASRCTSSGRTAGASSRTCGASRGAVLNAGSLQGQAVIPSITTGPAFHFPAATLIYFQFVFAAITVIDARARCSAGSTSRPGSRSDLWSGLIYTVNAFLIWGGGWLGLSRCAWTIRAATSSISPPACPALSPRRWWGRACNATARSTRPTACMVATGAGLLWLGWNGFNGGDPLFRRSRTRRGRLQHEPLHGGGLSRPGSPGTTSPARSRASSRASTA